MANKKKEVVINTTKADIVNDISKRTGVEKALVQDIVEAFMDSVKDSLINKKQPVHLRGFGSFSRKERATKTARHIRNETTIIVPAHEIPAFKPSKSFVAAVKNSK